MHTHERDKRRHDGHDLHRCQDLFLPQHCGSAHSGRGSLPRTHTRTCPGHIRRAQDECQAQTEQDRVEPLEEHEEERDVRQRRAVHVFDLCSALECKQVRDLGLQIGREGPLTRLGRVHGDARRRVGVGLRRRRRGWSERLLSCARWGVAHGDGG